MTNEQQERLRNILEHYDSKHISLTDEEMLTLVLSPTSQPSKRMSLVAKRIMSIGGLQELMRELVNAPVGLQRFGLSFHEINHLVLSYELISRCHRIHIHKIKINNALDAEKIFRPELMHLDHEEMHVLILDTKNQVVEYSQPYKGTVNQACVRTSEIFRHAIMRNSPRILIAHNHPSGDSTSSDEDRNITIQLVQAGILLDIDVLDHLIIGNPSCTSLKEELKW